MNDNSKRTLSNRNTINISFTEFLHLAQAELQRRRGDDEDGANELALITAWLPELPGPYGVPRNIREAIGAAWFVSPRDCETFPSAALRLWEQYEFEDYKDSPSFGDWQIQTAPEAVSLSMADINNLPPP